MPNTENKKIKTSTSSNNGQVALEFSPSNLKQVFRKIVKEEVPFEILGQNIIIFPRDIAERFKNQTSFNCEEVEIISLFHLPRKEANQIRKRHLQTVNSTSH